MASPPSKRRGISLDARADTVGPLREFTEQPKADNAAGDAPASPRANAPDADPEALADLVAQLMRLNEAQEARWQRQEARLRRQMAELAARQPTSGSGRLSALLTLLILVGLGTLGYRLWPDIQTLAGTLNRTIADVARTAPELQAIQADIASVKSDLNRINGSVAAVKEDVTSVRTDLSSLRETVNTLPTKEDATRIAAAGGVKRQPQTLARNSDNPNERYRRAYPRMQW